MGQTKKIATCSSLGVILTVIGVAVIFLIPSIIQMVVHSRMPLLPNNPSYPMYRDLNIPIKQKFYFFNVTNPRDVELGRTAIVEEIGPFVFSMNMSKQDIVFSPDQSFFSFKEWKTFHFERELSSHDLNLTITTLNMPLVGMYSFFPGLDWKVREAAKFVIAHLRPGFFIEATIEELMFKGKKNPLSCISHIFSPKVQPDCYFSYFRGQNVSNDGVFKVATGKNNVPKINSLISLDNKTHLDFWDGEECNRIQGASNGELFPPLDVINTTRKSMRFFRTDFCRTFEIYLNETGVASEVGSLKVDRFRPLENSLDNATMNAQNACYRPNRNRTIDHTTTDGLDLSSVFEYLKQFGIDLSFLEALIKKIQASDRRPKAADFEEHPSGVFSLAPCHDNLPLFISWPHFLNADPIYRKNFYGLHPNFTKHQTYMNIEPQTGTPIDFIARLQVNAEIDPKFSLFPGLKRLMFPILWQEFSIHVSDEIADTIKFETSTLRIYAFVTATLVGMFGLSFLIYSIALMIIERQRNQRRIKEEEDDQSALIDNQDTTNNNSIPVIN